MYNQLAKTVCRSLAAALLCIAIPASAAVFSPKTFTLKNGLKVIVIENHRAPIAMQMVSELAGKPIELIPVSDEQMYEYFDSLGVARKSEDVDPNGPIPWASGACATSTWRSTTTSRTT